MTINPMSLDGRTIAVTGAGQGIGRATAELLAALGANVVLIDMNQDALADVVKAIGADRALALAGSVVDEAFVDDAVDQAVARFAGVHGLVNNAGITRTAMIERMTRENWQSVIDVNLTGVFQCLRSFGSRMVAQARDGQKPLGAIVNISSDAGRKGTIGQINYGAAKSGVLGITMSAAREWARYGVRVNTIAFGVVETPMTEVARGEKFRDKYLAEIPMGRFLEAEAAAKSIAFLLSDAADYITGQHLSVNGGFFISA
jgi:3-oxoacyl-[acyl-carrier protein] reductase